ncbi:MAG: DUF3784 domain-containing protein [Clostridium sp.]
MKNADISGIIVITLLVGGLFTFLGWVIRSQNAGDMLNGFDAKKYNKDKVSSIVGGDILHTGLLVVFVGVIGVFLSNTFYNYITFAQVGIVVLGIIKSMYDMDKKCRIKN